MVNYPFQFTVITPHLMDLMVPWLMPIFPVLALVETPISMMMRRSPSDLLGVIMLTFH